jgi:hypothetical protein
MQSSKTESKPPKAPAHENAETKEEEKNVDRDGRERQPNQHTDQK